MERYRYLMIAGLMMPLFGCSSGDIEESPFQTKSAPLTASSSHGGEHCASDHECDERSYCSFPVGECGHGGLGICSQLPASCSADVDAVCGCDGSTYRNRCTAALAGVSVLGAGECSPPSPHGLPSSDIWYCYGKLAPASACMLYAFDSEEECDALWNCDPLPGDILPGPVNPSPAIGYGQCCVHVHAACVTECQNPAGCTGVGDCMVVRSAGASD